MREHTSDKAFRNARNLRGEMTKAEELLWQALRDRRLLGLKFRRQMPIGHYIADFACVQHKLIVECDGRPHDDPDRRQRDAERDAWLREQGWLILRIPNDRVIGGTDLVLSDIRSALRLPSSDPASPGHLLPRAGEGCA